MRKLARCLTAALTTLVVLTFGGCFKEEDDLRSQECNGPCATISGVITTGDGNEPLTGIKVTANYETGYNVGQTVRKKAVAYTDESGRYQLRFAVREDEAGNGGYKVEMMADGEYYICRDKHPNFLFVYLTNDSSIVQNVFLPYRGYVKINTVGTEKMTGSDYLCVMIEPSIKETHFTCAQVFGWYKPDATRGSRVDVPANQKLIISNIVTRNQITTTTYDTLVLEKGEFVEHTAVFQ